MEKCKKTTEIINDVRDVHNILIRGGVKNISVSSRDGIIFCIEKNELAGQFDHIKLNKMIENSFLAVDNLINILSYSVINKKNGKIRCEKIYFRYLFYGKQIGNLKNNERFQNLSKYSQTNEKYEIEEEIAAA